MKTTLPDELAHELSKLISFAPVTADTTATKKLLDYAERELKKLGLKTKRGNQHGYGSLVAGTTSVTKSHVLLQAHVDVVPASSELFAMKHQADKLYGRGTYDMLFGLASFLVILRRLNDKKLLKQLDIGVMLSSDEEIGGLESAAPQITGYDCAVCFLPDAGGPDLLSVKAKGVLELAITAVGKSGHAARPLEYDNPIYKLAKIITDLQLAFPNTDPAATTCSLSKLQAGEALNQVPDSADLYVDIRYIAEDNPATIEKQVAAITAKHGGIVKRLICEPAFETPFNNPHVQHFVDIYQSCTGRPLTLTTAPGSSDARFFTAKNIPVIMTRPLGGGMHANDEWISLSGLVEFSNVLQKFLVEVGQPAVPLHDVSSRPYNKEEL